MSRVQEYPVSNSRTNWATGGYRSSSPSTRAIIKSPPGSQSCIVPFGSMISYKRSKNKPRSLKTPAVSFRRSNRRSYQQRDRTEPTRPSRHAPTSGTITKISAQERNPNRLNIFLDGEFAFGIGLDAAATQQL